MRDVFISYGGPDEAFAARLCERLKIAGIDAFFFPDSAEYGLRLSNVMRDEINNAKCLVLICSQASLDRNGVSNEIEESLSREALEGGRSFIIPIAIDNFVFKDWTPANPGMALAIRQRVIGDFTRARRSKKVFEKNLGRLIYTIKRRILEDSDRSIEIYNFNPASGKTDEKFGVSEWPRVRGRISFIKWIDPGGENYSPTYPYDRPNRVLTVHRLKENKRVWIEYNLTKIEDGKGIWEGPSHHWVEAEFDYSAIGNRPGLVLFRRDLIAFSAGEDRVKILEFALPNDSVERLASGLRTVLSMRWTTDKIGVLLEKREVPVDIVGFEETDFVVTEIVVDP